MKNKGFTLIELLAVIILLVIIFMIIVPNVTKIINNSEDTIYQNQINTILNAAYDLSLKNTKYLPDKNNKSFITLGELKSKGLINSDIKDPTTKEVFSDDLVVSIVNVGNNYKSKSKYSKSSGNYLYTLEIELMNSPDYKSKRPTIELVGLVKNSEGNYVTNIDINETYDDVSYKAMSSDGKDLTSNVIINITKEDKFLEKIDTSKVGIYHINYTVIDYNGYSRTITRSIIVSDNTPPTIIIPEETKISKNVTSFDLMKDVSCEDNSGDCKITSTGEINLGVSGKYVIEYTVQDSSGNTVTKKRIITIE